MCKLHNSLINNILPPSCLVATLSEITTGPTKTTSWVRLVMLEGIRLVLMILLRHKILVKINNLEHKMMTTLVKMIMRDK